MFRNLTTDVLRDGYVQPTEARAKELRTFVDPDLLDHDEVWAAAGTWNDVFPLDPHALAELDGASVTELKRSMINALFSNQFNLHAQCQSLRF